SLRPGCRTTLSATARLDRWLRRDGNRQAARLGTEQALGQGGGLAGRPVDVGPAVAAGVGAREVEHAADVAGVRREGHADGGAQLRAAAERGGEGRLDAVGD